MMAGMLANGVLIGGDGRYDPQCHPKDSLSKPGRDVDYELTDDGRRFLAGVGIDPAARGRRLVGYCVDWTEQRHHLSGAVGRALLEHFVAAQWVKRASRGRAVIVTERGRGALADHFGVTWDD